MKKRIFLRGTMAAMAAVMSLGCVSAFAGTNYTGVSSSSTVINYGGLMGTMYKGGSNTTVITNGGGNSVNTVDNRNDLYNILGEIGVYVDLTQNYTDVLNGKY